MMLLVGIFKETGIFGCLAIQIAQIAQVAGAHTGVPWGRYHRTLRFPRQRDDHTPGLPDNALPRRHPGRGPGAVPDRGGYRIEYRCTATLVGDSPNIVIGTATGLSFMANLGPSAVVILAVTLPIFWFLRAQYTLLGGDTA